MIVWVCEDDNDVNDREVEVSTSVTLDGSDSWAGCDPDDSSCYSEEYLVEWKWDLDTYTDSDNDGITDNDAMQQVRHIHGNPDQQELGRSS